MRLLKIQAQIFVPKAAGTSSSHRNPRCQIIGPQVFDRSRARAGGSAAALLLVLSPCFTDFGNVGRSIFARAKHLSPFELAPVSFCSRPDTRLQQDINEFMGFYRVSWGASPNVVGVIIENKTSCNCESCKRSNGCGGLDLNQRPSGYETNENKI